jgi:4-amino-4-deoxy-L-arabinose transferase-like glycosyltransferase
LLLACAATVAVCLHTEAYGNTYYAAAVKSMLASWHNFFYMSSDLGGFVSVDKPPLGLWIQVLSAKLLGFTGVALLLPQALAGVASVFVLYLVVKRVFGGAAGLIAAAALAVMPISVVTARNNTMDTTLVLTLVAWRRKLAHLSAALAVLLVVSLSWSLVVDLTPANLRPYVGSSGSNSAIALALTYNGLGRITQAVAPWLAVLHISLPLDLNNMPGFAPGIGDPSLWRLFTPTLAGQASWLLAPAIVGGLFAAGAVFATRRSQLARVRRQSIALVVWGGWLLTCGAYFEFARFYHTYYLTMLGPAIAALVGIGVMALWRAYGRADAWGWALPIVLAASGVLEVHFASASTLWQSRLEPWLLATIVGGSLVLAVARLVRGNAAWRIWALSVALVGLLIAPTMWSVTGVQSGAGGAWLPAAGLQQ